MLGQGARRQFKWLRGRVKTRPIGFTLFPPPARAFFPTSCLARASVCVLLWRLAINWVLLHVEAAAPFAEGGCPRRLEVLQYQGHV